MPKISKINGYETSKYGFNKFYSLIFRIQKTEINKFGTYEGEFKNGLKDGKGTMNYKNEYAYEGDWKEGKREGKGTYINKITQEKLEGDFKSDKAEGKGIATYKDGSKYEGDYKNWQKDGKGIYYLLK